MIDGLIGVSGPLNQVERPRRSTIPKALPNDPSKSRPTIHPTLGGMAFEGSGSVAGAGVSMVLAPRGRVLVGIRGRRIGTAAGWSLLQGSGWGKREGEGCQPRHRQIHPYRPFEQTGDRVAWFVRFGATACWRKLGPGNDSVGIWVSGWVEGWRNDWKLSDCVSFYIGGN